MSNRSERYAGAWHWSPQTKRVPKTPPEYYFSMRSELKMGDTYTPAQHCDDKEALTISLALMYDSVRSKDMPLGPLIEPRDNPGSVLTTELIKERLTMCRSRQTLEAYNITLWAVKTDYVDLILKYTDLDIDLSLMTNEIGVIA